MQYPRVVGAYPAAGQFLRADLATIILYSKERVGKYPAVIHSVLMFPPSFTYLKDCTVLEVIHVHGFC